MKSQDKHSESEPPAPPHREERLVSAVTTVKKACLATRALLQLVPGNKPHQLIKNANQLAKSKASADFKVGLVGASGDGKSSTLNSVLDLDNLARADALGSAATGYPIGYQQAAVNQTAAFNLTAQFQSPSKIEKYLGQLFGKLRSPMLQLEVKNDLEREAIRLEHDEAKGVFDALFTDVEDYDHTTLSLELALSRIRELLTEIEFADGNKSQEKWNFEAEATEEVNEKLAVIRSKGLWPFLESVQIFCKTPILGGHLNLVDLPGMHDSNIARVRMSMRSQAECRFFVVVVNISRAVTNSMIQQTYDSMVKRQKCNETTGFEFAVVCTHAGDIHSEAERGSMSQLVQDKSTLLKVQRQICELKKDEDMPRVKFEKTMESLERQRDGILIEARNSSVRDGLHKRYGADLRVFCIDNVMYWRDKVADREENDISGIPQLRSFLADLPQQTIFAHDDKLLDKDFPAFVHSYQSWVTSNLADPLLNQHPRLPEPKALSAALTKVEEWYVEMRVSQKTNIDAVLQDRSNTIKERCTEIIYTAKDWHHSTLQALMRHRGVHYSPKIGYIDWNQDIVSIFSEELEASWKVFKVEANTLKGELLELVRECWQDYGAACFKSDPDSDIPKSVSYHLEVVIRALEDRQSEYDFRVRCIKSNALSEHQAGYINELLLSSYSKASGLYGKTY